MAVKIKIVVFWVMALCNLVGGTYPLHLQGISNPSNKRREGGGTRAQTSQWASMDRMKSNINPCKGVQKEL